MPLTDLTLDQLGIALGCREIIVDAERELPTLTEQCLAAAADKAALVTGVLPATYTKGADEGLLSRCRTVIANLRDARTKLQELAKDDPLIARATACIKAVRALRAELSAEA